LQLFKALSGYGEKSFLPSASIAAIFYILPHPFPFFPPGEGATTGDAGFLGQMLLFYAFHI